MDNMPSNLLKMQQNILTLKEKVNLYKNIMLELSNDINKIDNNFNNYIKFINKPKKKQKKGFAAPSAISNDLASFLNLPNDTLISRTEVTKLLTDYIKNNNLQNSLDKTQIVPNDSLSKLIDYDSTTKLTFFNIQKLLNKHFIKN